MVEAVLDACYRCRGLDLAIELVWGGANGAALPTDKEVVARDRFISNYAHRLKREQGSDLEIGKVLALMSGTGAVRDFLRKVGEGVVTSHLLQQQTRGHGHLQVMVKQWWVVSVAIDPHPVTVTVTVPKWRHSPTCCATEGDVGGPGEAERAGGRAGAPAGGRHALRAHGQARPGRALLRHAQAAQGGPSHPTVGGAQRLRHGGVRCWRLGR